MAYYVYMMANDHKTTVYTGVTNDLKRRAYEHRNGLMKGFTKMYNVKNLVYYEIFEDVNQALPGKNRSRQARGQRRKL